MKYITQIGYGGQSNVYIVPGKTKVVRKEFTDVKSAMWEKSVRQRIIKPIENKYYFSSFINEVPIESIQENSSDCGLNRLPSNNKINTGKTGKVSNSTSNNTTGVQSTVSSEMHLGVGVLDLYLERLDCDVSRHLKDNRFTDELYPKIMFIQMAAAVWKLHSVNVCHGDIKPSNFLLDLQSKRGFPTVKLADFGGTMVFTQRLVCNVRPKCYTPKYSPPELLSSSSEVKSNGGSMRLMQDPFARDIYALGVILEELTENLSYKCPSLLLLISAMKSGLFIEEVVSSYWMNHPSQGREYLDSLMTIKVQQYVPNLIQSNIPESHINSFNYPMN